MKRKRTNNDRTLSATADPESRGESSHMDHVRQHEWTSTKRAIVSAFLLAYLFVLLLGPMNNPVGSDHLSRPLGRWIAPVHQALFLGHGYRFFGPDPGPGHWVECQIKSADNQVSVTRFPDRQKHWPRLLYHRWFMLAETLFSELNGTPDQESFDQAQVALQSEIDQLRSAGKLSASLRLAVQRDELGREYQQTRARIDQLVKAVAKHFLKQQADAVSIELFLRERSIPFPEDVQDGVALTAERFISDPVSIGKFSRSDLFSESILPEPVALNPLQATPGVREVSP